MNLIQGPDSHCLVYSAAMVLECKPLQLYSTIGHKGKEILWPDLNAPHCFRNFHIQEIIDCFISYGFGLMQIDRELLIEPSENATHNKLLVTMPDTSPKSIYPESEYEDRFKAYLTGSDAILIGITQDARQHAVAWDGERAHDCRGYIIGGYDYYEFTTRCALLKTELISNMY